VQLQKDNSKTERPYAPLLQDYINKKYYLYSINDSLRSISVN